MGTRSGRVEASRVARSVLAVGAAAIGTFCMTLAPVVARDFTAFSRKDRMSDVAALAPRVDPLLVNPWGIAAGPETALWVNDEGTGVSTVYVGNGLPMPPTPLVVTVAPPNGTAGPSHPTGIVFSELAASDPTAFVVTNGSASAPSLFIFVTLDGTISGWNPGVDLTHSFNGLDNSSTGAVYTGLAIVEDKIFAANFAQNRLEIYDKNWGFLGLGTDPGLPTDRDWAPFGAWAHEDELYVAFAVRGSDGRAVREPGLGIVSLFDGDGAFVRRVATGAPLNAPWGMTEAPEDFGDFGEAFLVGNFGDGTINAFDDETGEHLGTLRDFDGNPIVTDGLWGIGFGNGVRSGKTDRLNFAAGIENETHGMLGQFGTRGHSSE